MLNTPWIDPRDIDWTDALNPLSPGRNANNNPFVHKALNDPIMQALRLGRGIEPRIYVAPDPQNQVIPAGNTYDYEVLSEPNCFLWALTASGDGDDFLFNVYDAITGTTISASPLSFKTMKTLTTGRGPLFILSTPHLYEPPSYPVVRIINTQAAAHTCRVTLYTCVEYDV